MTETKITPRFKTKFNEEVTPALQEEFNYSNVMQAPKFVKVVVNMGVGEAARDAKLMDGAIRDLTAITGQKPLVTRAKKSIAQFKLREGQPIGAHVTLRGDRMWEFLDRLITLALPRIRDFRGLSDQQFDGNGNYTFGLTAFAVWTSPLLPPQRPMTKAAHCSRRLASRSKPSNDYVVGPSR